MTGREGHINKVKDAKIVALMFGGLGDFYTDRRSFKQQGRRSGAALPGPMRDGGSRSGVNKSNGL